MAGNLGDLKARILYETNRSSTDFDTGVTNAIVTAIKYMEDSHPWVFTKTGVITITAGNNATNLPADFNQLIDIKFNIGSVLYGIKQGFTMLPFVDLNANFSSTNEPGYPQKYALYGSQLYVWPYTNTDVTLTLNYYYKDATYPAINADVSIWFNDQTIDALRNKALEIFYRDTLQSPEIADTYVRAFDDYSRRLSSKNNKRSIFNPLSI